MNIEVEKLNAKIEILTIKVSELIEQIIPSSKEYLSVKETAKYLNCSESMVYKLVESDAILYHKPNNGKVFIKRSSVLVWIETNGRI